MSLQIQETELSRGNTSKDTFLFIYTPKYLSIDSFCGCSLRAGIKIVSGFLLFIAISSFYAVLKEDKLTEIIFSSILTFFYLTASIYLFLSIIYLDYKYSRIGYIIYSIIFLIDTFDFLFVECFMISGVLEVNISYPILMEIIFFIIGLIVILIELYMLWISFCFMVHLKLKRLNIVYGDNFATLLSN
jgi:hypothetical protein